MVDEQVDVAFVGCGYVSNFYATTLQNHPILNLSGVFDIRAERRAAVASLYDVHCFDSVEELLGSDNVQIVVNLTSPASHYEVTRQCLESGKHVYTEKPIALEMNDALGLLHSAAGKELMLISAPCTVLSEPARVVKRVLDSGAIGKPLLAYAELDDGPMQSLAFREWMSPSGASWPFYTEFELGCVIEHAAYYVSWLTSFFGPVGRITSVSKCLYPEKADEVRKSGPDFSVGLLEFKSGMIARITCTTVAPRDRSLRIIGTEGVVRVDDGWRNDSRITVDRFGEVVGEAEKILRGPDHWDPLRGRPRSFGYEDTHQIDFSLGVAVLAESILHGYQLEFTGEDAAHVLEVVLALSSGGSREMV